MTSDKFLTKGLDWEYEQEWRMIVPLSGATEVLPIEPTEVHLFAFPKAIIKSVIFGARIRETLKQRLLVAIKNDSEYRHVRLQQARVDNVRYHLNFEDISR